jgi:hypothetical protein
MFPFDIVRRNYSGMSQSFQSYLKPFKKILLRMKRAKTDSIVSYARHIHEFPMLPDGPPT